MVVDVVLELAPVDCTVVDCVTEIDGIRARIGDVTVSTIVRAGLCVVNLCPVMMPLLNVKVS